METGAANWLIAPGNALLRSRSIAISTALVLTVFIGFFDYVTGALISLSAFYLIPVTIAVMATVQAIAGADDVSAGDADRRLRVAARAGLRADSDRGAHLGHAHRAGRL